MTRPRVPGRLAPVAPLPPRCDPERAGSFLARDRSEPTAAASTSGGSVTPRCSSAVGATGARSSSPQARTSDTSRVASSASLTFVTATGCLASSTAIIAPDELREDDPLDRGSRSPETVSSETRSVTRPRVPGRLAPVAPLPPLRDPERVGSFLAADRSELTAAPTTSCRSGEPLSGSGTRGATGAHSSSPQARTSDTSRVASSASLTFVTATGCLASSTAIITPDELREDDPLDRGSRSPETVSSKTRSVTRPRVPGRLAPVAPLPPLRDPERVGSFLAADRSELTAAPTTSCRSGEPLSGSGAGGATGARSARPQESTTGSSTMTVATARTHLLNRESGWLLTANRDPESVAFSMLKSVAFSMPIDRGQAGCIAARAPTGRTGPRDFVHRLNCSSNSVFSESRSERAPRLSSPGRRQSLVARVAIRSRRAVFPRGP